MELHEYGWQAFLLKPDHLVAPSAYRPVKDSQAQRRQSASGNQELARICDMHGMHTSHRRERITSLDCAGRTISEAMTS